MDKFFAAFKSFQRVEVLNHGKSPKGDVKITGEAFGKSLTKANDIPNFFNTIINHLSENCETHSLFRRSGEKDVIEEIVSVLDIGEDLTLSEFKELGDIHDLCGVLKMYFKEMPDCLLHYKLYAEWIYAIKLEDESEKDEAMKILCGKINEGHSKIVKELMVVMSKVANSKSNLMDAEAVCISLAPNFLRPQKIDFSAFEDAQTICKIVQYLINNHSKLF